MNSAFECCISLEKNIAMKSHHIFTVYNTLKFLSTMSVLVFVVSVSVSVC